MRRKATPNKGKVELGCRPTLGEMEKDLVSHVLEMEKSLFGIKPIDLRKLALQVEALLLSAVSLLHSYYWITSQWVLRKLYLGVHTY